MKFTSREINTIPNYMTAARGASIPKLYGMVRDDPGKNWWIAAIFAATDKADGASARLGDKSEILANIGFRRSEIGRKLDPTVDKVFGAAILIAGMKSRAIPKWLGVACLAQKATASAVTLNAERQGIELEVSRVGQIAEAATATGVIGMLGAEAIQNPVVKTVVKVGAEALTIAGVGIATVATIGYAQESGLIPTPELNDTTRKQLSAAGF